MSLVALIVCVQLAVDDAHIGLATSFLGSIPPSVGSCRRHHLHVHHQNTLKTIPDPRRCGAPDLGVTTDL